MEKSSWYENFTLRNMRGDFDVDWNAFDQPRRKITLQEWRERNATYESSIVHEENILDMMTPWSEIEEPQPNRSESEPNSRPVNWSLTPLESRRLFDAHWPLIQKCRQRDSPSDQFSIQTVRSSEGQNGGEDNAEHLMTISGSQVEDATCTAGIQRQGKRKPTGRKCRKRQQAKRRMLFQHRKKMERKERNGSLTL